MNFNKHVKATIKTVAHKVFILSKIRRYINEKAALSLFKTMVWPFFDYDDFIYEAANNALLTKLQRLFNRSLRVVFINREAQSRVELYRKAYVVPLEQPQFVDNRNLLTRAHNKKLLHVPYPKCEKVKNSVAYKGSILWNELSTERQQAESYDIFKNETKKYDHTRYFELN